MVELFAAGRVSGGEPKGPFAPFDTGWLRATYVERRELEGAQATLLEVLLDVTSHLGSGGYGVTSPLQHLGVEPGNHGWLRGRDD